MKVFVAILIAFALIHACQSDNILAVFMRDYYKACDIHQIVIFACWENAAHLARNIMGLDTVVAYQSITNGVDLRNILLVNYYRVGVVLDFDCPFGESILDEFSTQLHFNESYHWLVLSKFTTIPVNYLGRLSLTIASELTFATRADDVFKLYEIYNPSYRHGGAVRIITKGEWIPGTGLIRVQYSLSEYKYKRRADLQGLSLNFSLTLANRPLPDLLTYLSSPTNRELDPMTRSQYPLALYLQDMYNFSMKLHQATTFGYLVNGSYNGIIGDIISGFIDMSITPFEFHVPRLKVIDYAVVTWYADTTFVFLHPKSSTLRNNFLKPFTNDLWWMILLVAAIYWLLLLLSLLLEQHHQAGTRDASLSAIETGLTTLAALSQQGLGDSPNFYSGRITFLSLFFWALLLYQFYSASIVSSLMTPPPRWIKSIKDLSESDIEVGAREHPYFHNYFEKMTDPDCIELYDRKMKSPTKNRNGFLPVDRGFKKVQEGGYAFITESAVTYQILHDTFSEDEICALQEVRVGRPRWLAPILPKNSPFKKMIIYGLRKMVQSGLLNRLQKIWRASRPQCPESYNTKPTPMSMKEFSPALILLCIGVIISVVTLMMEYLYFYLETRLNSIRMIVEGSTEQYDDQNAEVFT
ncbi:ionotropic receptor 75a [Diachasma alloeum]|uniref:Ionotropic receptor 64a.5 n=1 Tax=Diachasma alloeum TaxID=454923 RepID=A0A4E0RT57_9HYME|nr:ionotropic receptor 75a [Diachasma alloeum]THK33137.1 ionotropic receptor 64a.5 [Diachasma alloeum]